MLLIKNACVVDSKNNIDGDIMDLCILDGKIVEDAPCENVIDAKNRVVMPAGIDIHSHIAGSAINKARILRPDDVNLYAIKLGHLRVETGVTVPNVHAIGYRYAKMGYSFVLEPASTPLTAKHTHHELERIPIIDKAMLILLGNNHFVLNALSESNDDLRSLVQWYLATTKAYGIKVVNPGGQYLWKYGKNVHHMEDDIDGLGISPKDIVYRLSKLNEELKSPHPLHLHTINLGAPGNIDSTLKTIESVRGIENANRSTLHLTHIQYFSYGGSGWGDFESESERIAQAIDSNKNITADIGAIHLGNATTMTADAPFEFALHKMTKQKWINSEVEFESTKGIVPYTYSKNILVNTIQWCIGLELALLVKDKERIHLTTDSPNGAPFTCYPTLISWLMDKKSRMEYLNTLVDKTQDRSYLASCDDELTLFDLCKMTRSGPAKTLNFEAKGHLGVGADADLVMYDLNFEDKAPKKIQSAFSSCNYLIKNGEIVIKDHNIQNTKIGKIHTSEEEGRLPKHIEDQFKRYYSIEPENFAI